MNRTTDTTNERYSRSPTLLFPRHPCPQTSPTPTYYYPGGILAKIITEEINGSLCRSPKEEVTTTIFSIGILKAPKPNGFPIYLYQSSWDQVGSELIGTL